MPKRLLLITQVIDPTDPVLGFFIRWVEEIAKHVETVEIICLREGENSLPANVRVHSLGKERGRPVLGSIVYAWRFLKLIVLLRNHYGAVLVHMNPEYVVLGGLFWRLTGKRIGMWYMHKTVDLKLRMAVTLAHVVYTGSPASMRIDTPKKRVMGQGIDTEQLLPVTPPLADHPIKLVTVTRLSPVKRVEVLLEMMALLKERHVESTLTIAGKAAQPSDESYAAGLPAKAAELGIADRVRFVGAVRRADLPKLFSDAHLFVHSSGTGSLDKASLEPLAAGMPIVTTNEDLAHAVCSAINPVPADPIAFADAVERLARDRAYASPEIREEARRYVLENHCLALLAKRLIQGLAR